MWPWLEPPFTKDISFVQGDDLSIPVNLQTPTSGFVFDAHLTTASGQVAFTAETAGDIGTVVELFLGSSVTTDLGVGVYPWQFSFTDALGLRKTWYQGNATVIANQ